MAKRPAAEAAPPETGADTEDLLNLGSIEEEEHEPMNMPAPKKKQRASATKVKCLTRLETSDGILRLPGDVVAMTDADIKHFRKHQAVESVYEDDD